MKKMRLEISTLVGVSDANLVLVAVNVLTFTHS